MSGQSFVGASATPVAGATGWYRLGLTGQLPGSLATAIIRVLNGSGQQIYAGDGTSGVLVFGPQLTQGVDLRPFTVTKGAISGPQLFNPPAVLTPGGVETWAAVAGGAFWNGANVWLSYDGVNYQLVGSTSGGPARFGTLTASFASHADPDTTNTLAVDLSASNGVLTSATQATADATGTMCLVDSELVGFEVATLTAPNRYNLTTYIRRGLLNTAIAAHGAGAEIIRLDGAIFPFPYNAAQVAKIASVKFQSVNPWGAATPLSQCNAYNAVPVPAGGAAPSSTAWSAVGTTITNGGQSTPAILITGHSDNPSATAIEFFYRQTGQSAWIASGFCAPTTTSKYIVGVAANQTYDVAVAYLVSGILTPLQIITSGGTGTGGGGSGGTPGTALLNDSVAGSGKTFTIPSAFTGAHVDIVLTGFPGAGNGTNTGGKGGSFTDQGGGGAGVVIAKGFPATIGDVFTYALPSAVGSDATVTKTGLSLTAHPGTNATSAASGTGAAASAGNTATGAASLNSYAGRNGGLTDTWDGGGPGATIVVSSGTVTTPGADNTADGNAGAVPGQAGAGTWFSVSPGGGCNLLIIARA